MPVREPPENDDEFLSYHAPVYRATCECEDCDRFREIIGVERGGEVDLEGDYGLDTSISPMPDVDEGVCDVCEDREAKYTMENDGVSCEDCWSEAYICYCEHCSSFFHVDEDIVTWRNNGEKGGDSLPCSECVEGGRVESWICGDCSSVVLEGTSDRHLTRNNEEVCSECIRHYSQCYECTDYIHRESWNGSYLESGESVCRECIETLYDTCNGGCGRIINAETGTGCRCPDDRIWNYSFCPPLNYRSGKYEPSHEKYERNRKNNNRLGRLYYGVEVEVEIPTRPRSEVSLFVDEFPYLFCKNDSSIGRGFEIVSHPFTYQWLQEKGSEIEGLFEALRDMGCEGDSTTTCGMHVHMDRRAFTRVHLLKFMRLVYQDSAFICNVSQRGAIADLRRYSSISEVDGDKDPVLIQKARTNRNENRRRSVAVNVSNGSTVEIRLFRSTVLYSTFMKNMEFCHAAFLFSKKTSLRNIDVDNFVNWVCDRQKEYPSLFKFLSDHGYC